MTVIVAVAENLISDPKTTLQPRLDRYKASVAKTADVQQVTITAAMTVPQVAAIARANPGPFQMFGAVPVPQCYDSNVDGHGDFVGDLDTFYAVNDSAVYQSFPDGSYRLIYGVPMVRPVGRVDFSGMPEVGDELALTAAWLDLNDAVRSGAFQYDTASLLNCELDYLFPGIGDELIYYMEAVTGKGTALDTRGKFPFQQFYQTYRGKNPLCAAMYDGGNPNAVGEYNTGFEADFASGLVKMCAALLFCSRGQWFEHYPLQRAMLAGGSMAVCYGTAVPPNFGGWSDTVPIGQAWISGGARFPVIGDCMLLKPATGGGDDMSQALADAINARIDALTNRVAALEGANTVVVNNPPTVARMNIGGPTITDPAGDWIGGNGTAGTALAQKTPVDTTACPGVPSAVLQTGAYSGTPNTFKFTGLPPGKVMTLRLYFAETYQTARTQRISCGSQTLDNFNIATAAGGAGKAVFKDIEGVVVAADGSLSFTATVLSGDGNTWISGAAVM